MPERVEDRWWEADPVVGGQAALSPPQEVPQQGNWWEADPVVGAEPPQAAAPSPAPQPVMQSPVQALATDVAGTDVAGRMMGRGTFEAVGGAIGTGLGMVGGPVGGVIGGTLGVMGGSAAYDAANELIRWFSGEEQPGPAMDRLASTVEYMVGAGAMDAATLGAMRLAAPAARGIGRALTGVSETIAGRVQSARDVGIEPVVRSVGPRGAAISSAIERLPFVGSERAATRITRQIDEVMERTLNNIGPDLTRDEAADLVALGGKKYAVDATNEINRRYNLLRSRSEALGHPTVFSSDPLTAAGQAYSREIGLEAVKPAVATVPTAKDITSLTRLDDPNTFLNALGHLNGVRLNFPQYQALRNTVKKLRAKAGPQTVDGPAVDPTAYHFLGKVSEGLDDVLRSSTNPELADMATSAANHYSEFKEFINRPEFREFRTAVPEIERGSEWHKPLRRETQDLLDMLVKERSPRNIGHIHDLVGDEAFAQISRRMITQQFGKAIQQTDAGVRIDTKALREGLGLDTDEGLDWLEQVLKGSDVTVNDVRRLTDALDLVGDQFLPQISQFMTRHLAFKAAGSGLSGGVLKNLQGLVLAGAGGAAATVGAGPVGAAMGAVPTILSLRALNESLTSRRALNWMLKAVEAHKANRPMEQFLRRIVAEVERSGESDFQDTRPAPQRRNPLAAPEALR